jgi:hypothetical protein
MDEYMTDFTFYRGYSAGWWQSVFDTDEAISSGLYIWFGVFTYDYWEPRFDFGGKCYADNYSSAYNSAPNTYPLLNVNIYRDHILSMYFTYNAAAQNFVRTLTQGVSLPDSRIVAGDYKRITSQFVQAEATHTRRLAIFKRIQDTLSINDITTKVLSGFRRIQGTVNNFDLNKISFLNIRQITETIKASDTLSHLRDLFRGLVDIAGTESKAKTAWLHFRAISETAMAISSVSRGLFLFVRIVSSIFIRDHLLGRFLKSKAELSLKSCVTREISLESKVN